MAELSQDFAFEKYAHLVRIELVEATRRYLRDVELPDNKEAMKQTRDHYKTFGADIDRFLDVLNSMEETQLEEDLFLGFQLGRKSERTDDAPQMLKTGVQNGAPFRAELMRQLGNLKSAAEFGIEKSTHPKGRERSYTLETLIRRCDYIWTTELGRKFSLDYHANSPISEAGRFVMAVIARIDPEIDEKRIITAMRNVIRDRNKSE
ncbi:MAG: hypothetical protein AAF498_02040 [Pseudomonadota bacterium]